MSSSAGVGRIFPDTRAHGGPATTHNIDFIVKWAPEKVLLVGVEIGKLGESHLREPWETVGGWFFMRVRRWVSGKHVRGS